MNNKINEKNSNNTNIWKIVVLLLYVVLLTIVSIYHEAWFDESQAWMISKESTIYELLFVIPHSEGHPPLWSLILYPLSHSGISYEICMKSLMVVISTVNTALILWKSPFPSIVKAMLPFTYFFFYQYGVIARPYGLLIMAMLLTAMTYKDRNDKPWLHVISLIYLCLTSAYGIVIAGSIAIVWVLEIWNRQNVLEWLKGFVNDKRFMPLLVLLICGLLLIYMIMPDKGVYTGTAYEENNFFIRLIMCLVILPVETTCTQSFKSYSSLKKMQFSMTSFVIEIVLGIILWVALIYIAKKTKKMMLLILPYIVLSVFASSVYFVIHHTGIMMIYIMVWCFIVCEELDMREKGYISYLRESLKVNKLTRKLTDKERCMISRCAGLVVVLSLVISVGWSVFASYNEINGQYFYAKELSEFLREHKMYELNILTECSDFTAKDGKKTVNTYNVQNVVSILPYLSDKEAEAFIQCRNGKKYVTQRLATADDNKRNAKLWAEEGQPDVLIGNCDLELIYGDKVTINDFYPVKRITFGYEWKNLKFPQNALIYVRKELLKKYGLSKMSDNDLSVNNEGMATQRVEKK